MNKYIQRYTTGIGICLISLILSGFAQADPALRVTPEGNVEIKDGKLDFGSTTRQMVKLWSYSNGTPVYGIGVQSYTQYYRSFKNFAWYKGGSHSDAELSSGEGGTTLMTLNGSGDLNVTGNVGIGASNPGAKLHIISQNTDANGSTLILGPTNQSNLRLGYHQDYTWVQSHGIKPLVINPLLSNVGIGTTNPTAKLDVAGDLNVSGQLKINNQKPIIIKKYHSITDTRETEYSVSDYSAVIAGFISHDGDINESGKMDHPIRLYMYQNGDKWYINADIASHNHSETWDVEVMFIKRNLVSDLR